MPLPAGSPDERTPRSNGASGSQIPAASLLWFASTPRDRIASHEPPRFDGGWVPPDGHPAWSPRPVARHAPAPVVAPTTRVERHVIAPTPIREIASRRIVASRPTLTTSPNTGRRFAAPDPLLRLLSGAAPHQERATPVIHPRFLDPRPRKVPDRAREIPPGGERHGRHASRRRDRAGTRSRLLRLSVTRPRGAGDPSPRAAAGRFARTVGRFTRTIARRAGRDREGQARQASAPSARRRRGPDLRRV